MSRNVFLCFVEEDFDLVNLFRGQAKKESSELEFSDYSVKVPFDSSDADYIERQITELIQRVSVTICLIGKTTCLSTWVHWELITSASMGKGLVGVRLHSSADDIPPSTLAENRAELVNWDIKGIVRAIERAAVKAGY